MNSDDEFQSTVGAGEQREAAPDEPMSYCPVCNAKLHQHQCKLLCGRCGYYMSCADFY